MRARLDRRLLAHRRPHRRRARRRRADGRAAPVFDTPRDQLVWDVGHQGYPHKLLTGRNDADGDAAAGRRASPASSSAPRASTTRSAPATRRRRSRRRSAWPPAATSAASDFKVVAVLGDGALTLRARVRGAEQRRPLRSRHRRRAERQRDVDRAQRRRDAQVPHVDPAQPALQPPARRRSARSSTARPARVGTHRAEVGGEREGVPHARRAVRGARLPLLRPDRRPRHRRAASTRSTAVRELDGPRLVHVITQKGKGFPAGEHGEKWHALPPGHDPATGKQLKAVDRRIRSTRRCSARGSRELDDASARTSSRSPRRCRAARAPARSRRRTRRASSTSASPRATRSRSPPAWRRAACARSCAIYSTFLQRAYDNIIHDVAHPAAAGDLRMDRAGLVGEDGETHMGLYDIAYMLAVPDMTVTAPKDGDARCSRCCATALDARRPARSACAIRATRAPDVPPRWRDRRRCRTARGRCCAAEARSRSSPSARWSAPSLAGRGDARRRGARRRRW